MADASANAPLASGLLLIVLEKLTHGKYNMWHATVSSVLKGARLASYIRSMTAPTPEFLKDASTPADDKKPKPQPNPAYEKWIAEDHIVLGYLFNSLSKEVFGQVATTTTVAELWVAIQALYASQFWARVMSTRMALTTVTKGTLLVAEFFIKMKGLSNDMASARKKLEDEELVSFILTGLGEDFNSIVTAMASRVEPITVNELYAQLVAFEQCKEIHGGGLSHLSIWPPSSGGG